jgi:hypothetical protein
MRPDSFPTMPVALMSLFAATMALTKVHALVTGITAACDWLAARTRAAPVRACGPIAARIAYLKGQYDDLGLLVLPRNRWVAFLKACDIPDIVD